VGIARPGQDAITYDAVSGAVATALLAALGQRVREVTITSGKLAVVFAHGMTLTVEPGERFEPWQIADDEELLIVCSPGGGLTAWYPPAHG
jgi:hypothetical protein